MKNKPHALCMAGEAEIQCILVVFMLTLYGMKINQLLVIFTFKHMAG